MNALVRTLPLLAVGDTTLDPKRRQVVRGQTTINLSPYDCCVLFVLMQHAGQMMSGAEIAARLWGEPVESDERVEVIIRHAIRHMRERIEPHPSRPIYVRTLTKHGYVFVGQDEAVCT